MKFIAYASTNVILAHPSRTIAACDRALGANGRAASGKSVVSPKQSPKRVDDIKANSVLFGALQASFVQAKEEVAESESSLSASSESEDGSDDEAGTATLSKSTKGATLFSATRLY